MAAWSSLKWAVAATCAVGLMQAEALPTVASRDGTVELSPSLFRRQNFFAFSGIQEGFGTAKDQVPLRKEIREMISNPAEFNLFLLALQRFQQLPQSNEKSYYAISGIHGRPFKPWDNVLGAKDMKDNGYCTHKDKLFLPWHRPYLALYEQLIWENARDIVNEFPEPKKTQYKAVLPTLRMPYWDWASNSTIPREVGDMATVKVDTPKGEQTIPNPLYSHKFTDIAEFSDLSSPLAKMKETVRYPQEINGVWVSQYDPLNRVMENASGGMTNVVYKILTAYKDFNLVTTSGRNRMTGRPLDSLESVHDNIHNAIGGPIGGPLGHMADISMAAFDPIFWLHHTNIDRLFAIWQEINPTGYTFSGQSDFGTFTIPPETKEDLDTALTPFHQTGSTFWTSRAAARTQTFGYTYAETNDWNIPAQERANKAIAAVNRLYGQDTPAGALNLALTLPVPKGSNLPVMSMNNPLNVPPSANILAGYKKTLVQDGKYNEWVAEIQVNQAALNGQFRVYVFLGDVTDDVSKWDTSKSFVGTFSVLTPMEGVHSHVAEGTVPLTAALLNMLVSSQVENLQRETVTPYLLKNLKLKVAAAGGKAADIKTVTDLKVTVSSSTVTLPKTESEVPQWATPQVAINFIDVPAGVFTPTAQN
ncbi:Tyrosinase [Orbilia brochopaga]|nr:Tyrosinase [Drechslerella brochopaga]